MIPQEIKKQIMQLGNDFANKKSRDKLHDLIFSALDKYSTKHDYQTKTT